MKVKAISRVEEDYTRECKSDKIAIHRNLDPILHPMHQAKEYKRALNAVKLDKVFAKPFVGALEGHCDGITAMAKSQDDLSLLLSGAADGEIYLWDLPSRKPLCSFDGHKSAVRGLAVLKDGARAVSVGDDAIVRMWRLPKARLGQMSRAGGRRGAKRDAVPHHSNHSYIP